MYIVKMESLSNFGPKNDCKKWELFHGLNFN